MPVQRSASDYLPLTHLAFHVLLALADEPRHGYAIVRAIREQSDGRIDPGTGSFYSIVRGLCDQRLIEAVAAPDDDAPERRRYYGLTALGRRVLEAESARLAGLVRDLRRRGLGRTVKAAGR